MISGHCPFMFYTAGLYTFQVFCPICLESPSSEPLGPPLSAWHTGLGLSLLSSSSGDHFLQPASVGRHQVDLLPDHPVAAEPKRGPVCVLCLFEKYKFLLLPCLCKELGSKLVAWPFRHISALLRPNISGPMVVWSLCTFQHTWGNIIQVHKHHTASFF